MTTERSRRVRGLVLTALVGMLCLVALEFPAQAASTPVPAWTAVTTPTAPGARQGAAVAYDGATNQVVLFGGLSGSGNLLNDTWLWNGTAWTRANPTSSPAPREDASLAYDANLHEMILFGGITQVAAPGGTPTLSSETWAWNGASWFALSPGTSPPARSGAVLVGANNGSGQFVLFGGSGLASDGVTPVTLDDTWTYDGSTWTQQQPAGNPTARTAASAAWDPHLGEVVLFGGDGTTGWLGDTWIWNGTTWTPLTPATKPPARGLSVLAYDTDLGGDVLFGGQSTTGLLNDTWVFTGTTWAAVGAPDPPGPRSSSGAAWDSASHQFVLFGGAAGSTAVYGDTATLTVTTPSPPTGHPTTTTTTTPPAPAHRTTPTTTSPSHPHGAPSTTTVPASHHAVSTTVPTTRAPAEAVNPPQAPVTAAPLKSTANRVHTGETVTLSGGGFASGTMVTITFHSFPSTIVGSVHADGEGRFTAVVSVPKQAPAGAHHFEATGMNADGHEVVLTAAIDVVATTPAPGGHRTETLVMVALAILIPATTWLVLSLHSRRGRRSATAT